MNEDYLKMTIWNNIQLLLCAIGLFTKGIVDLIFFILWLIAFVITISYMVKNIKQLIKDKKRMKEIDECIKAIQKLNKVHNEFK